MPVEFLGLTTPPVFKAGPTTPPVLDQIDAPGYMHVSICLQV